MILTPYLHDERTSYTVFSSAFLYLTYIEFLFDYIVNYLKQIEVNKLQDLWW